MKYIHTHGYYRYIFTHVDSHFASTRQDLLAQEKAINSPDQWIFESLHVALQTSLSHLSKTLDVATYQRSVVYLPMSRQLLPRAKVPGDWFVFLQMWLRLDQWKPQNLAHRSGDRHIPWTLLWVDRGILHVGPTKSLTTLAGFSLRVAMKMVK